MRHTVMLAACTLTLAGGTTFAESGFLADYSRLEPVTSPTGTDRVYTAPDAAKRMANYTRVLIDWPEIHFSADSPYRGMKPQDIQALAKIMRDTLTARIEAGGHYAVIAKPGPDVLYIRTALTELYLKTKKRPALAYTPIGHVAKVGTDALKETLDKVDIIEMTLEAEIADSQSGEVLAALMVERGARQRKAESQKEERMDMDEFRATIREYAERLRCRLDNASLAEAQWIDCTNPQAREGGEGGRT